MSLIRWQKSSYSEQAPDSACVELARGAGALRLRESDEPGVIATTTPDRTRALLQAIKHGHFDPLAADAG